MKQLQEKEMKAAFGMNTAQHNVRTSGQNPTEYPISSLPLQEKETTATLANNTVANNTVARCRC